MEKFKYRSICFSVFIFCGFHCRQAFGDTGIDGNIVASSLTVTGPVLMSSLTATGFLSAQSLQVSSNVSVVGVISSTGIVGTKTNDNGAAGNVGEYISALGTSINVPTSGWVNVASIFISSGDWDISGVETIVLDFSLSGNALLAISAYSGNTNTDLVLGDNYQGVSYQTAGNWMGMSIPTWRVSTAVAETIYLKTAVQGNGTEHAYGRLSARRMR